MAQVKFYRGLKGAYNGTTTHQDCIYFATDTNELLLNGVAYGMSVTNSETLKKAITSVEWVTPDTIKFSCGDTHEHVTIVLPSATESAKGLMDPAQVTKLKGIEAGAQVNVIEKVIVDGIEGTISEKTATITGGFAKAADVYTKSEVYTKEEVNTKLSAVYEYKGSVDNYSDLPTNAEKGDVYNVANGYNLHPAGTNWVWDGTTWDALGGLVDLSEIETAIATNKTATETNATAINTEKERAEGVEGQLRTDLGQKTDTANAEGSAFARIANLAELVADITGGSTTSISAQIQAAVDGLKGDAASDYDTLGKLEDAILAEVSRASQAEGNLNTAIGNEETRAKGVEEALQAAINKLNGEATAEGSVAKAVKDAVDAEALARDNADKAINQSITDLTKTVNDNETDIENKYSALEARVATNETNIGTNVTNIASNLEKINAMDTAYKAADTKVKEDLIGASTDTIDASTIHGAKNYADSLLLWHEA